MPAPDATEVAQAVPLQVIRPAVQPEIRPRGMGIHHADMVAPPVPAGQREMLPVPPEVREAVESLGAHPAGLERRENIGQGPAMSIVAALLACALTVVDGDTLRCGGERIRLLGIDAPELPGHCRVGRQCVDGDPFASTAALERAVHRHGRVTIERVGRDRYGRTLALVKVGRRDLSCEQLQAGAAVYVERWDNALRLAAVCKAASG